jgi:hypothetical protein
VAQCAVLQPNPWRRLVVVPTGHVGAMDELSVEESEDLGGNLRGTSIARRSVTGCFKTHVPAVAATTKSTPY